MGVGFGISVNRAGTVPQAELIRPVTNKLTNAKVIEIPKRLGFIALRAGV